MHEADFTESHYRTVLRAAAARFTFAPFDARPPERHVLWRHDVDVSMQRALALARIEAEEGVRSTYLVMLHSEFYNLLEAGVSEHVREIIGLGHHLGLHFDAAYRRPHDPDELAELLSVERRFLQDTFEAPVGVFSFHNGELHDMLGYRADEIAGMVNAYGRTVFEEYQYVSDSNGRWRFERLADVIAQTTADRLQVLTHPEWWQAEAMPASDRIDRAIAGRALFTRRNYDRVLAMSGRDDNADDRRADVTVGQILAALPEARPLPGTDVQSDVAVARPAALGEAGPGTITFVGAGARAIPQALEAAVVIVDESIAERVDPSGWRVGAAVVSRRARLDYIRVVERFFAPPRPQGIDPAAMVAAGAQVADSAYVGPGATVATGVAVGERSVIHAGVHLYAGTRIGADVVIHAGAVIGADGFGYQRDEDARLWHFPHLGGVVIADRVEIGANTCIDRGTLSDTVIEEGVKIDNLVHIAHNVRIGADSVVVASVFVGGSTPIGARTWIGAGATLRDGIEVGDEGFVGLGAVVLKDVPPGVTVVGNPARPYEPRRP
jgi:UDP-3-O-[3-hydroxymyristoyl] glucosamine N-acyltransferase LpxD